MCWRSSELLLVTRSNDNHLKYRAEMILVPKRPVTNISHRLLDFIHPIRERVPSSPAKFVDIREKKEKFWR